MKTFKRLLILFLAIGLGNSCSDDDTSFALQEVSAPTNVNAIFNIAQDDSGIVTVTPTAEGATLFRILFGDTDGETPTEVAPGDTVTHSYAEGEYTLRIVAVGLTGLTSELARVVTISFQAPSNLVLGVEKSTSNPFEISVSPTATNATVFDVFLGDVEDEEPTTIMAGETATHVYAEVGQYTVRVVARGAGAGTIEGTEIVDITGASNAISLPITFDDPLVNYDFVTFNGSSFEVVANPDPSGANPENSNVGAITNSGNAFEGGAFNLGTPVDFSTPDKTITLKFWSQVAVPILLKFEGGVNGERENEVVSNHGGTGWEEISFDFANNAVKSFIDGNQGVGEPFVPEGQYATMVIFIDGPGNTAGTFFIDDIAKSGGLAVGNEPTEAAPNPLNPESSVISLFSEAYTNVPVDTWRTVWSDATLEEVTIAGNEVKKYSALGFVGVETVENQINASEMTHFRTDIWTADATAFNIKLVDFGADGAFGGGDDTEHEIVIENPAQGQWVSIDLPLSDFIGLTNREHIAQLIYVGAPFGANTVYVDNVFFYNENAASPPTAPATAAPTPSQAQANVIAMFSDAYTNVPVDTWRTVWSDATLEEVSIAGNDVKKYSALSFVGIETVATQIDASAMTHFRTDIWTADATEFRIKLVDFGADAAFGGGDDTEHEIVISNPPQGQWVSFDIPLSDFVGLTTRSNIAQLIYVGAPNAANTVFVDNVYFYNE
ncbi:hypothetical protein U1E44_00310 [Arenibacter sp. GZD96]|uniref:hypothetical protein n=1 Tax=Aurantibrevibacter litoralis TaxID=3106030 RepID=UPI002B0014F8|nr:hypothetical protein [Arenibacter sp. GZD-96]MEA1784521.1 hypothetical protein [Arenibacter sp. GZD-96]